MEKNRFTICANNYIDCLRQEGRYSTAHVYKHAIRSFSQFCGTQSITFSKINRETLKRYSNYLMASRLKPNTISTYMRMLRSIYLCTWFVPGCFYRGGHTSEESYPDRRTSHAIKQRSSIGKASPDAGHCQSVISVLWNAFF